MRNLTDTPDEATMMPKSIDNIKLDVYLRNNAELENTDQIKQNDEKWSSSQSLKQHNYRDSEG